MMLMFYCQNSEPRKYQVKLRGSGIGRSLKQNTRKLFYLRQEDS